MRCWWLPLILFALQPGTSRAADRPNIILVTLDTVRAERMGFLGSKRRLTPQLDTLARQGVVFERAYAQAPLTTVSHATILTGTYPQFHRVNDFGVLLSANLPYLPELLRAQGYRTAAFVGSLILDPRNGLAPGFDRGFETFDAGYRIRRGRENRYQTMERRAEEVWARALAWLEAHARAPFFLWLHFWDPHDPYDPPAPYKQRFSAAPYDGEIAYLDATLGKFFAELRARELFDGALLVIVSDHGEALGQHGEKTHGVFLYDATIHVPLLVKLPNGARAGQRVKTRVSLVDLGPTLLEAAGLPVPSLMQGQSLLRLMEGASRADRPSYAETDYPRRAFGWSSLASLRAENYLFIRAPRPELYSLAEDGDAKRNLAATQKFVANRLAARLEGFRRRSAGSAAEVPAPSLDPKIVEKLTALGYVAASRSLTASETDGIDPKDKIAVVNTLHDAILAVEEGQTETAIPLLQRVLSSDPQIYIAQFQLGVAYARKRAYARAIGPLRKAIELLPDSALAHYELGVALFETGDWKTAAGHFEIVVARMPKWADARFSLASVYARTDRVPEAITELRTAIGLNPKHYRANLLLGRILTLQNQAAAALPYLEQAVVTEPDSSEAHAFLGDAYARLGRDREAQREKAKAETLKRRRTS